MATWCTGPTNKYVRNIGSERVALNQALYSIISESLSGLRQVKTFNIEALQVEAASRHLQHNITLAIKGDVIGKLPTPAGELLVVAIISVVICYVQLHSSKTLSDIFPVIGMFAIAARPLMAHISSLAAQRINITANMPSLELVHRLAAGKSIEKSPDKPAIPSLRSGITFQDVTFAYPGKEPILHDVTLFIPKGKTTAFIGPSGVGKSTILDLILALFPPASGDILIDGIPLSEFDPLSWRQTIGFVSQDTFIFNRSVKENILLGKLTADDEEVHAAGVKAFAHDFISVLPQGYDTILGDRGVSLSGGQRQRIAIAVPLSVIPTPLFLMRPRALWT